MSADIFLSYSSNDRSHALSLAERLRTGGMSVWIDQAGLEGAALWGQEIVDAIESCSVLLVLVSRSSIDSHNVVKEVSLASEKKKHILPVDLENVQLPKSLQYPLAGIHRIACDHDAILRSLTKLGVGNTPRDLKGRATHDLRGRATTVSTTNSALRTVAVLPFTNISSEPDTDYFSDGLTEELISTLSRLKDLRVTSRTSVMEYKGTKVNLKSIGRELGVRYIIEGSVRKHGENLRMSSELIDVMTDTHLWSETYKGTMADIFDIQESVAKRIVAGLSLVLRPEEEKRITKRCTGNPEAYELYLRAEEYLLRFTKEDYLYAIELYKQAIKLDPAFALAYAKMSSTYADYYRLYDRRAEWIDKADTAAQEAIRIDDHLPQAYNSLALVQFYIGNTNEAIETAKKAIEVDPKSSRGYFQLGFIYSQCNQLLKSAEQYENGIELNPNSMIIHHNLTNTYSRLGDKANLQRAAERSLPLFERHVLKHPDDKFNRMCYAFICEHLEKYEESKREIDKVLAMANLDANILYGISCFYACRSEKLRALELLERSIKAGYAEHERIKADPFLDSIRGEPEFKRLMEESCLNLDSLDYRIT